MADDTDPRERFMSLLALSPSGTTSLPLLADSWRRFCHYAPILLNRPEPMLRLFVDYDLRPAEFVEHPFASGLSFGHGPWCADYLVVGGVFAVFAPSSHWSFAFGSEVQCRGHDSTVLVDARSIGATRSFTTSGIESLVVGFARAER